MKIVAIIFLLTINLVAHCQDSTLKQRFVVNLLSEYDKGGRWVFVKIDSCSTKQWVEVVSLDSIYRALSEGFSEFSKESFIWNASINILQHNIFSECPETDSLYGPPRKHHFSGIKVDLSYYSKLSKQSIHFILSEYFDSQKMLKTKYKNKLYEIIAVCFKHNIKVITTSGGAAFYEIFK